MKKIGRGRPRGTKNSDKLQRQLKHIEPKKAKLIRVIDFEF